MGDMYCHRLSHKHSRYANSTQKWVDSRVAWNYSLLITCLFKAAGK